MDKELVLERSRGLYNLFVRHPKSNDRFSQGILSSLRVEDADVVAKAVDCVFTVPKGLTDENEHMFSGAMMATMDITTSLAIYGIQRAESDTASIQLGLKLFSPIAKG